MTQTQSKGITTRERDILDKICQGLTAKEIGASLNISTYTVDSHRKNLIQKFNARNTVHMVVRALSIVRQSHSSLYHEAYSTKYNNHSSHIA